MTKRREPLTYQATLEDVARAIGWERAGALCGVTARAVRLWSDHDCETEIRMIDAERLDRAFLDAGGTHAPFHRLMSLRLDISACAPSGDIANAASVAAKEAGEAVAALIVLSTAPGDEGARRAAAKEVQEAVNALTESAAIVSGVGGSVS